MSNTRMRLDNDFTFAAKPKTFAAPAQQPKPQPAARRPAAPANPGNSPRQPAKPKQSGGLLGLLRSVFVPRQKTPAELEAEGKAAKDRSDAMRARAEGKQSPREAQGFAAGTRAGLTTPMLKAQEAQDKKQAEQALVDRQQITSQEGRRGAYTSGPRELGATDYEALSPRARAAVDFNGLLQAAITRDNELVAGSDTDRSGLVTMTEASKLMGQDPGYSAAYKRIFGRDVDTKSTAYAPNVLGLLNSLDLKDGDGRLEDYVQGRGYVNSKDIESASVDKPYFPQNKISEGDQRTEARTALVNTIADSMSRTQEVLKGGRLTVYGSSEEVSLAGVDREARAGLVEAMRKSLTRSDANNQFNLAGDNPRFDASGGVDLSGLVPRGRRLELAENAIGELLNDALTNGVPPSVLSNPEELARMNANGNPFGVTTEELVAFTRGNLAESLGTGKSATVGATLEEGLMEEIRTAAGGNQ